MRRYSARSLGGVASSVVYWEALKRANSSSDRRRSQNRKRCQRGRDDDRARPHRYLYRLPLDREVRLRLQVEGGAVVREHCVSQLQQRFQNEMRLRVPEGQRHESLCGGAGDDTARKIYHLSPAFACSGRAFTERSFDFAASESVVGFDRPFSQVSGAELLDCGVCEKCTEVTSIMAGADGGSHWNCCPRDSRAPPGR